MIEGGKQFFYEQNSLGDIREAYKRGEDVMSTSCSTPSGELGIESFMNKRKPVWTQ